MDAQTIVMRALSGVGKKTVYASPGKQPPLTAASWPADAKCDCSGFVAWALRWPREVDHPLYNRVNGGWFETTALHADGVESTGFFNPLTTAKPGALLVYPDYRGSDGKMHDGHVGIVVEANGSGIKGVAKIVHCSLGAWKNLGDAIQVTDSGPWQKHKESLIIWLDGTT